MKQTRRMLSLILFMVSLTVGIAAENAAINKNLFIERERIPIKFGDFPVAEILDIQKLPDGFIFVINQSSSPMGEKYALVKVSGQGSVLKVYDKLGSGPGELKRISNCAVTDKSILVSESYLPVVHEYSHNLEFLKDHRINGGGRIFLIGDNIGIWHNHVKAVNNKNKSLMLSIYDKNYNYLKSAFEVTDIPVLAQSVGGMCKVNSKTYAGVYASHYQIYLFDENMNYKKNLLNKVPEYIKSHTAYNKDPNKIDNNSIKWYESWSKIFKVDFIEGKYILYHTLKAKEYAIDILDVNGKPIVSNYKRNEKDLSYICLIEGKNVWKMSPNEDATEFTLIRCNFNLK